VNIAIQIKILEYLSGQKNCNAAIIKIAKLIGVGKIHNLSTSDQCSVNLIKLEKKRNNLAHCMNNIS
jgi:hypothetical protein